MKIAFLYPRISHYREEFFEFFDEKYDTDIYVYEDQSDSKKNNFAISPINTINLKSKLLLDRVRIFNFLPLLSTKYDVVIIIGEMKVLPTWLIMFLLRFKKTKTILWGHGISIHNYLEEQENLKPIRILYHKLADYVWLYTEGEKKIWSKHIDPNKIEYLNNTIDVKKIASLPKLDKEELKKKYNITAKITFIFCARFAMQERRIDLLTQLIEELNNKDYYFIIIGAGPIKPDFSKYSNVLDCGQVYDADKKNELFTLADLYYQPGWLGLSVNEAFGYAKPIVSFKRTKEILQCVEYSYLNEQNSYLANNMNDLIKYLENLEQEKITQMSQSAREYALENLTVENMISRADEALKKIAKD